MVKAIEAITRTKPVQHWIDRLNAAGVPCSPINTIDKLFDHQQLLARDMFIKVKGMGPKTVRTAGNPIRMSGYFPNDTTTPIPAPGLGQHREAILHEFMAKRDSYHSSADGDLPEPKEDLNTYQDVAAKISAE